jgi:hypothetical protein
MIQHFEEFQIKLFFKLNILFFLFKKKNYMLESTLAPFRKEMAEKFPEIGQRINK